MQKIRLQPVSRITVTILDSPRWTMMSNFTAWFPYFARIVPIILSLGENRGDYMGTLATSKYLVTRVLCLENHGPAVVNRE